MAGPIRRSILPHYQLLNPSPGGRIWMLWNPIIVEVDVISYSDQYLHCKVSPLNLQHKQYFITVVYASNSSSNRLTLWQNLEHIATTIGLKKWIVGGDFNEVRYSHEKLGGRPLYPRRIAKFNNCLSHCNLQDLRATGTDFSWSNRQSGKILCKLDRVLVNHEWMLSHPDSFYQTLPPGLSDHSMLKVSVSPPPTSSGPRPFKYFQAWELHPHFEQLISTSWSTSFYGSPMFVLVMKLKHLKGVLKQWNKDTFGTVQSSLQHSRSCLEQAQVASLQAPLDSSLSEIESIARDSYLHTLRIEESLLRQKSRQTWLREGDKNSKFFYSSIKSRIAQNCIRNVTLEDGSIVCEPNQVKQYAIHYFESLLNRQHHSVIPDLAPSVTLREDDRHQLNKPVSAEETGRRRYGTPLNLPVGASFVGKLLSTGYQRWIGYGRGKLCSPANVLFVQLKRSLFFISSSNVRMQPTFGPRSFAA
ncbi:hypothetical protein QJS10_CPB11g00529 [Acorus calamus]|uniref:Uncharacterized protein n=1 Tax=Acorus calamus TaxID=4465 RepID=A0AAV9DTJ4_ACOCL|nr:hypothetical protein QJS10_CPB11g00529 [Acorus calamus]